MNQGEHLQSCGVRKILYSEASIVSQGEVFQGRRASLVQGKVVQAFWHLCIDLLHLSAWPGAEAPASRCALATPALRSATHTAQQIVRLAESQKVASFWMHYASPPDGDSCAQLCCLRARSFVHRLSAQTAHCFTQTLSQISARFQGRWGKFCRNRRMSSFQQMCKRKQEPLAATVPTGWAAGVALCKGFLRKECIRHCC